ncbi:HlyD family secretion protein [Desulfobulbus alkaliphilus]|uniref:HlyD family secretion protein n=1 Tax=Desulfobulbus alkaliphilus TaxID=869814 RepID=UPI001965DD41|nr:biotin/lipoyl-binding protein [Desulfobulbus alkaliphilus]MBM9535856.1 biotin/lipoyl-binding protein [Desulfobulbus alkaliphilus]
MMKVRAITGFVLVILVVVIGLSYIQISLRKASTPPAPGRTPSLDTAPVRLYGLVEPLGREAFVGPPQPRRVERIFVQEGQGVSAGQALCELEQQVERQALEVAMARAKEFEGQLDILLDELTRELPLPGEGLAENRALQVAVQRVRELEVRLELILDELKRKAPLSRIGSISEVEYTQKSLEAELVRRQITTAKSQAVIEFSQKSLQAELLRRQIETARAEVELRKRELDTLTLRSPMQGRLYKFDVRIGEHFTPQDFQRIVIGKPEKQVRLFVESFWFDTVRIGDVFQVHNAETMVPIGLGKVVTVSQYMGARDFRSEDTFERLDTKYAQAILHLEGAESVPLNKLVLCVRENTQ